MVGLQLLKYQVFKLINFVIESTCLLSTSGLHSVSSIDVGSVPMAPTLAKSGGNSAKVMLSSSGR